MTAQRQVSEVTLRPRTLLKITASLGSILAVLGAATIILRFNFDHDHGMGLIPKFDLDREVNVPTWFSSSLLLCAAGLLAIVARLERSRRHRFRRHWSALACVFVMLSLDEAAALHGLTSSLVREAFELPAWLYYAWVVPAAVAVVVFVCIFARFTWLLPTRTRLLFVTAGVIYVSGALGGELALASIGEQAKGTSVFAWTAFVEEVLEMAGVTVFCYAIMDYLALAYGGVLFVISDAAVPPRSGA